MRYIVFFIASCLTLTAFSKNLKILMLNTPSIVIDNKLCKVNDVFDENDTISWQSNNQAMKVLSEDDKIYILSPSLFEKYHTTNFANYITSVKATIVRATGENFIVTKEDHRNLFEGNFPIIDIIEIPVGWRVDETSYFTARWNQDGIDKWLILPYNNGMVSISRTNFDISDEDTCEVQVYISYVEEDLDEETTITKSMNLEFLPLNLSSSGKDSTKK